MFKKILDGIGVGFSESWKFLSGKKRWITLGLLTLSKMVPEHTAVGVGTDFITANLDTIQIILEVGAGLFGVVAVGEVIKDKLPSGLRKGKEE